MHVRDLFAPSLDPVAPIGELVRTTTAYPPNKRLLAVLGEMRAPGRWPRSWTSTDR